MNSTNTQSGIQRQKVRNLDLIDPFGYPVYEDKESLMKNTTNTDQQKDMNPSGANVSQEAR